MKRRALLLGTAAAAACRGAAAADAALPGVLPGVLRRAAVATPLAPGAAMLAAARAGRRLMVAGERGLVLFSDDGGRQWTQAQVPVQVSLTALRFTDERRGLAAGHLGVLLGTADGGASWTLQMDGVRAAAATLAAATDDAQRKHAQRLVADGPDKPFFDIETAGDSAWVVGAYGLALEMQGGRWQSVAHRLPNPRHLHLYAVRSVGERMFVAGEQGLLLRSTDRGASFEPLASPYRGSFFGLLAARSGTLITYGLRGNAFRSTDFGSSWAALNIGVPMSLSAGIERDDGSLLLLAQNGDLLASRDDGRSFERRAAAPPFPAAALAAADGPGLVLAGLRGVKRIESA